MSDKDLPNDLVGAIDCFSLKNSEKFENLVECADCIGKDKESIGNNEIAKLMSCSKEDFEEIKCSETGKPYSVSRHDFVKENIERIKKLTVELEVQEEGSSISTKNSPIIIKYINSQKDKKSKDKSLEKTLDLKHEMPKHIEDRINGLKDLNISSKIDRKFSNTVKPLELKKIIAKEELQRKENLKKTASIDEENKLSSRRNSSSRIRNKRTEKSPPKRVASKQPERPASCDLITTSLKSQDVLANKFIKEFEKIIQDLNLNNDDIDLDHTITILTNLRFINNEPGSLSFDNEVSLVDKLWKLFGGNPTIKTSSLMTMCLHIMNLYKANSYFIDENCANIKTWTIVNGINVYSPDEALKIHKQYYDFYQNRRFGIKSYKHHVKTSEESLPKDSGGSLLIKSKSNMSENIGNGIKKPPISRERSYKIHSPGKTKDYGEEKKRPLSRGYRSPNKIVQGLEKHNSSVEGDFSIDCQKSRNRHENDEFYNDKIQKGVLGTRKVREDKAKKIEKIEVLTSKQFRKTNSCEEGKSQSTVHTRKPSYGSSVSSQSRHPINNRNKSISQKDRKPIENPKNKNIADKDKNSKKSQEKGLKIECPVHEPNSCLELVSFETSMMQIDDNNTRNSIIKNTETDIEMYSKDEVKNLGTKIIYIDLGKDDENIECEEDLVLVLNSNEKEIQDKKENYCVFDNKSHIHHVDCFEDKNADRENSETSLGSPNEYEAKVVGKIDKLDDKIGVLEGEGKFDENRLEDDDKIHEEKRGNCGKVGGNFLEEKDTELTTEKQDEIWTFIKTYNLPMNSFEKLKEIFFKK
ncbi:hypothetical protein SteCoe_2175 [Stentor coeruleus]|uniref:Uncharacterized protein n=1 Tax=Stentor coeruleus TaxID=5963 RepID=A0A1R2D0A8_9CILI|nr:hypothetical protein SteCoe_2175 [Stentor coeruleus]